MLDTKWLAIVNPEAGSGRGRKDWPKIKHLLEESGIEFDYKVTERKFHAVELAVSAINHGYRKLLVVGGDGTLNEIVNGVFIQKRVIPSDLLIGVIGIGTGNDWQRNYNLPGNYEGKVLAIKNGNCFYQDVGKVEFFESKIKHTRYFANAAGLGFDAEVARATNKLKESGRKGKILYIFSVLKTLIGYNTSLVSISIDDKSIGGKIFSVLLGIGRYHGGGMMQVPDALPDDGLFDITVVDNMKRREVVRSLYRLYDGTILKHPKIKGYKGKSIFVSSRPPVNLEADGESLGSSPFTFSIIPKSIKVIVGADFRSVSGIVHE